MYQVPDWKSGIKVVSTGLHSPVRVCGSPSPESSSIVRHTESAGPKRLNKVGPMNNKGGRNLELKQNIQTGK